MAWTRIADANAVEEGDCMPVELPGVPPLALFRHEGSYFVTDNVCTHATATLTDGFFEDGCIECPLHQARFDVRTGAALCAPATEPIRVYPVRVDEQGVYVDC